METPKMSGPEKKPLSELLCPNCGPITVSDFEVAVVSGVEHVSCKGCGRNTEKMPLLSHAFNILKRECDFFQTQADCIKDEVKADVLAAFASYMGQQLTTEACPQKHPCINQCNAHLATDGICTGCWRSVDEIRDYNGMTDKEKSVVALLCRARRDIPRLVGTLAALPDGTKKNITSYGVACFMLGRRSAKIDKIVGGS